MPLVMNIDFTVRFTIAQKIWHNNHKHNMSHFSLFLVLLMIIHRTIRTHVS